MEAIRAEKLIKSFKDGDRITDVLKSIDLSINKGDFVAVTGASGTGKSTLMYQLGLLDLPTSGEIYIDGKQTSVMSSKAKAKFRLFNFGFVFQDYALLPELNAWENVALPMVMRGYSLKDAKEKARQTLSKFGLEDRIEHNPSELSGGESQRVSIARAIVHNPKILFADEPTANLDSEKSAQIINTFKELHDEGQTIIMITHELEYTKVATRVLVIKDGIIQNE